jgi:signal transduction histidine kinase
MDEQLNKRMTLILTIGVIVVAVILLLHTTQFSIGLCLLACGYVILVLIRDYILKLDLQRMTGTLFIILQLTLSLILTVWSESFFAQIYPLILVGEFTFYHTRNHSIIFTLVSYVSCVFSQLIYHDFPPFEEIYYILPRAIDYFALFGISLLAKVAFQQKNQLARDNEQLRMASIELETKAKLQERTRISRDIHDSVGHTLTSALTGLQTASHAIKKNEYPLALEMIDRTNETILRGLNDVRTSVHLLRENIPGDPFISELIRLIKETMKQTHVDITYEMDTTIPDLPPMIELTIYRALQEGITNGIRHGACNHFRFSLTHQAGLIRFILSDNGNPPLQIVPGFGLNAMKERVEDLGGDFAISTRGSTRGVTLEITIPIQSTNEQTG